MDPITTVATVLRGITSATRLGLDAARGISEADLKLKVLQIVDTLGEARGEISRLDDEGRELRTEIDRLNEALRIKGRIRKHGDAYFMRDDNGLPDPDPHCVPCWEIRHKPIHLTRVKPMSSKEYICPGCSHTVMSDRAVAPEYW